MYFKNRSLSHLMHMLLECDSENTVYPSSFPYFTSPVPTFVVSACTTFVFIRFKSGKAGKENWLERSASHPSGHL